MTLPQSLISMGLKLLTIWPTEGKSDHLKSVFQLSEADRMKFDNIALGTSFGADGAKYL